MAFNNESDEALKSRAIASKAEAMAAWQHWLNWGENDKVGAGLIHTIAQFGAGDPEIIDFLESRTQSGIALIRSAAYSALIHLEGDGDELASAARKRCQEYEHNQWMAQRQARAQRQRAFDRQQADRLGISLEEFYAVKEQERSAQLAKEEERRRELASSSRFQAGQRVKCIIPNWPYTNAIGIVEQAVTKYFVRVTFEDGYRTIQSDSAFELLP